MKQLTVNQSMNIITDYIDDISPKAPPVSLYKTLNHLRNMKQSLPNGGLLPYSNSAAIENKIAMLKARKNLKNKVVVNVII